MKILMNCSVIRASWEFWLFDFQLLSMNNLYVLVNYDESKLPTALIN